MTAPCVLRHQLGKLHPCRLVVVHAWVCPRSVLSTDRAVTDSREGRQKGAEEGLLADLGAAGDELQHRDGRDPVVVEIPAGSCSSEEERGPSCCQ